MDTKDCIFHFVTCESGTPVDLRQAYLKENDVFEDERICRLCMQNITYGFTSVEEEDVEMLGRYMPGIKFCGENEDVICNSCRRKLNAAIEFRSTCLNNGKMIISHVDCKKMLQLDLGEIYMKENGNGHLTGISYKPKICPLCMQLLTDEIGGIGDEEFEAIHKFIPEMNIRIIKDPVVCRPCLDSLYTHNAFLKDCLEKKQKIADTFESSAVESQAVAASSGLLIKTENLDNESEMNEEEMPIKIECVDIKSEVGEASDTVLLSSNSETFENSNSKDAEMRHELLKHKNRSVDKCDMESRENNFTFHASKSDKMYKCDKCVYESKSIVRLTSHYSKHSILSKVYKCETCDYVAKKKPLLKMHMLRHKDPWEVQMYRCDDCDYNTKYKKNLASHVLRHKYPSQEQIYKCEACNFESRYKNSLTNHQLIHQDALEVEMYECKECGFKTKYENGLAYHMLQHKDPSRVQMYKCDACDYESSRKSNFAQHLLTHKDPSEIEMYRCNDCNYITKYKRCLARHVLLHRDPSQLQVYKCDACDYESSRKCNFAQHLLTHKGASEVQIYRCND